MYNIKAAMDYQPFPPVGRVMQGGLPMVPLSVGIVLPKGMGFAKPAGPRVGLTEFSGPDGLGNLGADRTAGRTGTTGSSAPTGYVPQTQSQYYADMFAKLGVDVLGAGIAVGANALTQYTNQSFQTTTTPQQPIVIQAQPASGGGIDAATLYAMMQQQPTAPTQTGMDPMTMLMMQQAMQPKEEKKGLPTWAWALIAVGGVGVLGGGIYLATKKK